MKSLTILFILAFFVATGAFAQNRAVISTTGEAQIATVPDMATISIGVTTRAAEAEEALEQTSEGVAEVLKRLDQAGIAPTDMQTSGLSLFPVRTPRNGDNGQVSINGYEASNRVEVRVRDLDILGRLLDRVVADGANNLHGLSFGVQEPEPFLAEARAAAVRDAMARAAQLADAAGVSLGDILSISEDGGRVAPMREMAAARMADVPVVPGEVALSARVTMSFEIEQ